MSGDNRDLGIARGVIDFSDNIPQDGIGFYDWEKWGKDRFRWTGSRASVYVKNINFKHLQYMCSHPDIEQNPVVVTVFVDDNPVWKKEVKDKMWKKIELNPDSSIDGKVVTFQVSRTWNPKGMGISADGRDLGVAVK